MGIHHPLECSSPFFFEEARHEQYLTSELDMAGNNLYDSSVESYGTISKSSGVRNVGRAKISTASKVAPLIFLAVMIGLACISSTLQKDEHQVDQVCLFYLKVDS